jgi:hypothetical protein
MFRYNVVILHVMYIAIFISYIIPIVNNRNSSYRKSKFIDFINCKNDFKCFDISSCFFGGHIQVFRTSSLIFLFVCSV